MSSETVFLARGKKTVGPPWSTQMISHHTVHSQHNTIRSNHTTHWFIHLNKHVQRTMEPDFQTYWQQFIVRVSIMCSLAGNFQNVSELFGTPAADDGLTFDGTIKSFGKITRTATETQSDHALVFRKVPTSLLARCQPAASRPGTNPGHEERT
jgi:hypothetical protein